MNPQYIRIENGNTFHYSDKEMLILHNPNGPAIVWAEGHKAHYINGLLHNPNGPAVVWANGTEEYYINGRRHNSNGPAIVERKGVNRYCLNGHRLTEEQFNEVTKLNP
jgi:hypothetical protein